MSISRKIFYATLFILIQGIFNNSFGQCTVYDFYGDPVSDPYWYECSGSNFALNLQSPDTWSDYTIDWGDGSANTTGASWAPPNPITHIYTATVDTFVFTMVEIATGCTINGVVVMEEATSSSIQIPIGGITQACAPQEMEFINSSTNVSETTVFTWDFGDGSPIETYDYTNWNQTVAHTYEPGTVDCETVVSLTSENYCNTIQGGTSIATFNPIRIWDIDDAAIDASALVLCYPDTIVTFENITERNCLLQGNIVQRYEYWNFGDYWGEGQDSIIDWTPWPPTFPHTIAYPGLGSYQVMMLDSNYCGIDTAYITVQIVEPPEANIGISEDTICAGELITFFQYATGTIDEYSWNFGTNNTWLPTGSGNISYVFNDPGTYYICNAIGVASSSSCSDTACVILVVMPGPDAVINADSLTSCSALDVNFTDGSSVDAVNWEWTFDVAPFLHSGQDPPTISFPNQGNFGVTLTVENQFGCSNTVSDTVRIFPIPTAIFSASNACENSISEFIDQSSSDPNDPILSWVWDFDDGNTSSFQHPSNEFSSTGNFDVNLTVNTANCSSNVTTQITIDPSPTISISSDINSGCSLLDVQFTSNSTDATIFIWDFGDGSSSGLENPNHTFQNIGQNDTTYTVSVTASSAIGCSDIDSLNITVEPGALASFIDNSIPPGCSPYEAFFENTSIGATSYLWDFGDGASSTDVDPSHLYTNNTGFLQTYDVQLIAYSPSGCNDTIISSVTVYPTANFDFTLWPDSGCSPLIVTMPFIQGVTDFNWDFGDGNSSTIATPTHIFENPTNSPIVYDISLIGVSAFGCVDSTYSQVLVNPQPTAQFSMDITSGCSPLEISFENISLQSDSYNWEYGNGTSSDTSAVNHTTIFTNYSDSIVTYFIDLTAYSDDGCSHTYTASIQVFPEPVVSFEMPTEACSPINITLTNTSTNGAGYNWDFGNGVTSNQENPTITYTNNGLTDSIYTVCLDIISVMGCTSTHCEDITIHPSPEAIFSISSLAACSPEPLEITNTSLLATSYQWYYGDGTNSNNSDLIHEHIFENNSINQITYDIMLIASSVGGCNDTVINPFLLNPGFTAQFISEDEGCSPLDVSFTTQTLGEAANYSWDFGDGSSSNDENPDHIFYNTSQADVTYNIILVATSVFGCSDTTIQNVTVHPSPEAIFSIGSIEACSPEPVEIINASTLATSYQWSYDDGTTSSNSDVIHEHLFENNSENQITYDIMLTATGVGGCTDEITHPFILNPGFSLQFTSIEEGCSPLEVNFNTQTFGQAAEYSWDYGDGSSSGEENPSHTFFNTSLNDITYNVTLVGTSTFGCTDTVTTEVTVFHSPIANLEVDTILGCYPLDVYFENLSIGAESYTWVYGTGETGDSEELVHPHTYYNNFSDEPVSYDVTLIAYSDEGCSSSDGLSVSIWPELEAIFTADDEDCSPFPVSFHNQSIGAASYQWIFGDGTVNSSDQNPEHLFINPDIEDITYTIQLIATSTYGCIDTTALDVTVFSTPFANFNAQPNSQIFPDATISLENNSTSGSVNYNWDMDDGNDLTTQNPETYTYETWGEYEIELILTNGSCSDTAWQTIEILPPPPVAYFQMDTVGCNPMTLFFTSNSIYASSYLWDFGDGGQATVANPVYSYQQPGVYDITLTVTGFDPDQNDSFTILQAVTIYPNAQAAFTASPTEVYVPDQPVHTVNLTQSATSYYWDFGDGETSEEENPIHYYQEPGVYDITLIALNEWGCPDTYYVAAAVQALAIGSMEFPNAFTPNTNSSNGGAYDPTALDNDIFYPIHRGVTEFVFQIYDKWGELLFQSTDIHVGWDGYYKGNICKEDVYAWKVEARFSDNTRLIEAGNVTLLIK